MSTEGIDSNLPAKKLVGWDNNKTFMLSLFWTRRCWRHNRLPVQLKRKPFAYVVKGFFEYRHTVPVLEKAYSLYRCNYVFSCRGATS